MKYATPNAKHFTLTYVGLDNVVANIESSKVLSTYCINIGCY